MVQPRRALELASPDGVLWRLELAAFSGNRDVTPNLSSQVGKTLRLHVESMNFGVAHFVALRVSDAQGLVLALDFQVLEPLDDPHLGVLPGVTIRTTKDHCGTHTTSSLRFLADTQLDLEPGSSGTLRLQNRGYAAHNLASTFVTDDGRCTDLFGDVAWSLRRLADHE